MVLVALDGSKYGIAGVDYQPLWQYYSANSTYTTALALPASTTSEPTSLDGTGPYIQPYVYTPMLGRLMPIGRGRGFTIYVIGAGADDSTITKFQLIGWHKIVNGISDGNARTADLQGAVVEYQPTLIWSGAATLSTATGTTGGLGTSVRFADTITETDAIPSTLAGWSKGLVSPTGNVAAYVSLYSTVQHFDGYTLDADRGTATSTNFLIQTIQ